MKFHELSHQKLHITYPIKSLLLASLAPFYRYGSEILHCEVQRFSKFVSMLVAMQEFYPKSLSPEAPLSSTQLTKFNKCQVNTYLSIYLSAYT
jgi:hypothetical protein